jgi:hypothetical protein
LHEQSESSLRNAVRPVTESDAERVCDALDKRRHGWKIEPADIACKSVAEKLTVLSAKLH